MKYSIIIPSLTKNEEHNKVLEDCLDSVIANSKDCEIILVDDGSPIDLTFYPVDVYIRHRKNKGIAPSWNDGIKIARGKYVVIINDDITVQDGWLDKLRMALEMEEDYDVAAPGVAHLPLDIGIIENYKQFPGYCFMVKKTTFDTVGLFDEQFVPYNLEDWDFWTRILKSGGKLVRNYNTVITHREGDVLHTLNYNEVDSINKQKYIKKWGFDPTPIFWGPERLPWEK